MKPTRSTRRNPLPRTRTHLRRAGTSAAVSVVLVGLLFISQNAFAQEDQIQTGTESAPAPIVAGVSYQAATDIAKAGAGSFELTRVNAGLIASFRLNDTLSIIPSFRYEFANYDFSGKLDPWQDIHTLVLSALLHWQVNNDWSVYGGPIVCVSAESDANWSDAWSGGGLIGANYVFSEKLTLGGGLAVISQIEADALVLPLVTATWKFADDWRLKAGFIDIATVGYGADVGYNFSRDFVVSGGLQFHKSRFRLDAENGIGQETASVLYVAANWRAQERVDLDVFLGITAGGGLRGETSGGHKVFDTSYDPTPTLGLKVNVRL